MTGSGQKDENDKMIREIDAFIAKIGERCHSVRFFCVIPKGDSETTIYTVGNGDFFSQIGSIREWVMRQDEQTKCEARKEFNEE